MEDTQMRANAQNPQTDDDDDDARIWRAPEVLRRLPVSLSTLRQLEIDGELQSVRISTRLKGWRPSTVRAYIDRLAAKPIELARGMNGSPKNRD
jgi:predicted DNA-binding transcriptional regulator AlpA